MTVPVLGRLTWFDYKKLFLTIFILWAEGILRFIAWWIPVSILDFLRYRIVRISPRIFQGFHDEDIKEKRDPLSHAETTPQLIAFHGYRCEEHVVLTADGYYLVMHRILPNEENESQKNSQQTLPSPQLSVSSVRRNRRGSPIMVIHGALMSSEMWVCRRQTSKNLVFLLVDEGYDVWLCNRRGSKYSQKHVAYKIYQNRFWDFSIDETIVHDVPAQAEYIYGITGHKGLGMLGFSQGTAEIFGSLGINRKLQKRTSWVVGISATAKPPTPKNAMIRSMVHWTPELLFLLFGRKSMLSSFYFWQSILSPRAMSWLIDIVIDILFGWKHRNIRGRDKPLMYRHLYSTTSVKQISHWFQIMRAGNFKMYDEAAGTSSSIVPSFPMGIGETPKLLIFGEADCLVAPEALMKELQNATMLKIPEYEHIETVWAYDSDVKVYPAIMDFIRQHNGHLKNDSSQIIPTWPPT